MRWQVSGWIAGMQVNRRALAGRRGGGRERWIRRTFMTVRSLHSPFIAIRKPSNGCLLRVELMYTCTLFPQFVVLLPLFGYGTPGDRLRRLYWSIVVE